MLVEGHDAISTAASRRTCKVDNISAKANSKPQSTTAERAKDSPSKCANLQDAVQELPFVIRLPTATCTGEGSKDSEATTIATTAHLPSLPIPSPVPKSMASPHSTAHLPLLHLLATQHAVSPKNSPADDAFRKRIGEHPQTTAIAQPSASRDEKAAVRISHPLPPKPSWIREQVAVPTKTVETSTALSSAPPFPQSVYYSSSSPAMFQQEDCVSNPSLLPSSTPSCGTLGYPVVEMAPIIYPPSTSYSPSPTSSLSDSMLLEATTSFWGLDGSASTDLSDWSRSSENSFDECPNELQETSKEMASVRQPDSDCTLPSSGAPSPACVTQLLPSRGGISSASLPPFQPTHTRPVPQQTYEHVLPKERVCWEWMRGKCHCPRCKYPHVLPEVYPRHPPPQPGRLSTTGSAHGSTMPPFLPHITLPPRLAATSGGVHPGLGVATKRKTCVDWEAGWCFNQDGRCSRGVHRREGDYVCLVQAEEAKPKFISQALVPRDGKGRETCRKWEKGQCQYSALKCHRWHGLVPPQQGVAPQPVPPLVTPQQVPPISHLFAVLATPHLQAPPTPARPEKLAQTCSRWVKGQCGLSDTVCQRYHSFDIPAENPLAYTVHEHNHLLVTAGFAVKRVTTAFDTTWIFIDGIVDEPGSTDEISRRLEGYGRITGLIIRRKQPSSSPLSSTAVPVQQQEKAHSKRHSSIISSTRHKPSSAAPPCPTPPDMLFMKASFSEPGDALRAATHIHGTTINSSTLSAKLSRTHSSSPNALKSRNTSLRVEWETPRKVGYAGYQTLLDAEKAVARAHSSQLGDNVIVAHIHRDLPSVSAYTVKLEQVPANATKEDLHRFGRPDDVVWEAPTYETAQLQSGLDFVRSELAALTDIHAFDILPPPYRYGRLQLWAHFTCVAGAIAAATSLHHKRIPGLGRTRLEAVRVTEVHYVLSDREHTRITDDLLQLRRNAWCRAGKIVVRELVGRPVPGFTTIRLVADDANALGLAKVEMEVAIRGEVVTEGGSEHDGAESRGRVLWDSFFGYAVGGEYLLSLRVEHPQVKIEVDEIRRKLRVWGRQDRRALVEEALRQKVQELRCRKNHFIPIPGRILAPFMRNELLPLQRAIGPEKVSVRVWERILRIRGDDTNYQKALDAIQRCQEAYPVYRHLISTSTTSRSRDCPICFGEVTDHITLRCGHIYCKPCLSSYLESVLDHRTFPVHCVGDEAKCTAPVSIYTAQRVLTSAQFEALVQVSFQAYIHARSAEFRYCPTPDCQQIYRHPTPPGTILQCPSCLVRICPRCDTEYHDGLDCPDFSSTGLTVVQSRESDKQFRAWQVGRGADVKECPGCRVVIERSEGCNHVRCTKCGLHMCWMCMAVRESGGEVYDHMREAHGTIGGGLDWW